MKKCAAWVHNFCGGLQELKNILSEMPVKHRAYLIQHAVSGLRTSGASSHFAKQSWPARFSSSWTPTGRSVKTNLNTRARGMAVLAATPAAAGVPNQWAFKYSTALNELRRAAEDVPEEFRAYLTQYALGELWKACEGQMGYEDPPWVSAHPSTRPGSKTRRRPPPPPEEPGG